MLVREDWTETNTPGIKLYSKTWSPSSRPIVATLVFIHGIGEHCSRYNDMFQQFVNSGIKVGSFDSRGFGQTVRYNGRHGHNEGIENTMRDIECISNLTRVKGVPHFIMGHSMGGGLALLFAHKHQHSFTGCIASAPLIRLGKSTMPSSIEYFLLGHVLPKILPSFVITSNLDLSNLSRDPLEIEKYKSDPLIHRYASIQTLSDIVLRTEELLTKHYSSFNLPVYVTHGSSDRLSCPLSSQSFVHKISSVDKKHQMYDGFRHELHNEPATDRQLVIKNYIDWILERI